MFDKFLGLSLSDVTSLLEENNIPFKVIGEPIKDLDTRVIRVKQAEDGQLELLIDNFKTQV